ncbi:MULTISPECIES: AAA family ATPase [Paraburkholderia]|uniref:AAA family ATPase n=1 Tax=Paraburkholderia TaxID=1822464 RepID=UPI0005A6494D|nr:AAA family ATPase [Paraburkholderia ferrariae]
MAIRLIRLAASGPDRPVAEIEFSPLHCLIRGPSDTGKSYIRDCLWYLLGGEKTPKKVPEDDGYESLELEFADGTDTYIVRRALRGGGAHIFRTKRATDAADGARADDGSAEGAAVLMDAPEGMEPIDADLSELVVELSGAAGKQILRSKSKRGPVTGSDIRHWFMLSQPTVISEDPTSGASHSDRPQRMAAFHLFLTGNDDSAVALVKSQAEKDRLFGQLTSAQDALKRVLAGVDPEATRVDIEDAIERVDETLTEITRQYDARAVQLRDVRGQIVESTDALRKHATRASHSQSMLDRFKLLDQKYVSDLERLGALNEGVAHFAALEAVPCPICATPVELHVAPPDLGKRAPGSYRKAVAAESQKITGLRAGLLHSIAIEQRRLADATEQADLSRRRLRELEKEETRRISGARVEFQADPKELAVRRSELAKQLGAFDEKARLEAEIERLKKLRVSKAAPITRDAGEPAKVVATLVKSLLVEWGFDDVQQVTLDTGECDLVINDRARLSYGAGKRGIFLTALAIGLMKYALEAGNPHLGLVVIDSPLKAYADPDSGEERALPTRTLTDRFYAWLSTWSGPGQVVVAENEKIRTATADVLKPIEFTRRNDSGRAGFYLKSVVPMQTADDTRHE